MRTKAQAFFSRHALVTLAIGAALGPAAALFPATALADDSVVVLGITSLEGDDELARNLTGALRHAASQVHGWQVSDSEVTLAQMGLAHGCSDDPEPACVGQIASALGAQRIVYGVLRRSGSDFQLSLSSFDARTNAVDRSVSETIPGRRIDIDDLREPARRLIAQLSGPRTGGLRIASNVPDAAVSVDGEIAGRTDTQGAFSAPEVPVGEHRVSVAATGFDTWTGTVTIATGTEMTLDAELAPGAPGEPAGPGPSINWPGIALIVGGAAALGVSIYAWARIGAIQSDDAISQYRNASARSENICTLAGSNDLRGGGDLSAQMDRATRVNDLCGEASTLEVLQYVFLGIAVAAGATGAVLLVTDIGGSGGETEQAFQLTPSIGPDHAYLSARIRF